VSSLPPDRTSVYNKVEICSSAGFDVRSGGFLERNRSVASAIEK